MAAKSYDMDEEELLRQQREAEKRAHEDAKAQEAAAKESEESSRQAVQEAEEAAKNAASQAAQPAQEQKFGDVLGSGWAPAEQWDDAALAAHHEDAQFKMNVSAAKRDTKVHITEARIGELPEQLEQFRDTIEEKNRRGELYQRGGGEKKWIDNEFTVDYRTVKSVEQAAYFATTLDEEDKLPFFKQYANHSGQSYESVVSQAEKLLGDKLFAEPKTDAGRSRRQMSVLAGHDIYDHSGDILDLNRASANEVMAGIRNEPNKAAREEMAAAFVEMTKNPASPYYGVAVEEDWLKTFRNGRDLPQTTYDDVAGRWGGKWSAMTNSESKAQNLEAYMAEYDYIQSVYADNAYARNVLTRDLNAEFKSQTDYDAPTAAQMDIARRAMLAEQEARVAAETDEDEPSLLSKAWNAFTGFIDDIFPDKPAAEEPVAETPDAENVAQNVTEYPATLVASASPAPIPSASDRAGSERTLALPTQQPQGKTVPTIDQQIAMRAQAAKEAPVVGQAAAGDGRVNLTQDMATALEYVHTRRYDELDDATRAQLDEDWKNPGAQILVGVLTPNMQKLHESGNESADYVRRLNMQQLGGTLNRYSMITNGEDFPTELYGDMMYAMRGVTDSVDELMRNGDPDELAWYDKNRDEPAYEQYISAFPDSVKPMEGVLTALTEMREEKAAHDAQIKADADQLLADARMAKRNGVASAEQAELVAANAPELSVIERFKDPTFAQMSKAIDDEYFNAASYLGSTGGFFESWTYKTMEARGITSGDYEQEAEYFGVLKGEMHQTLQDDMDVAASLDMTLEQYYAVSGGSSLDTLAMRSHEAIVHFGGEITEADTQVLDKVYGPGIETGELVGGSMLAGYDSVTGKACQSVYTLAQISNPVVKAAKLESDYITEFGPFVAGEMYERDLRALLATGEVPEALAKDIQTALNGGAVFDIAIEPEAYGFVRSKGADKMASVESWHEYLETNATQKQNFVGMAIEGVTSNMLMYGATAATTAALGAAKMPAKAAQMLGMINGYGKSGFIDHLNLYSSQGYTVREGSFMAAGRVVADAMANVATFNKLTTRISGIPALFGRGISISGGASTTKAIGPVLGMAKAVGEGLLDEVVVDPAKGGAFGTFSDALIRPMIEANRAGELGLGTVLRSALGVAEAAPDAVRGAFMGVKESVAGEGKITAKSLAENLGMNIAVSLPLVILGAVGENGEGIRNSFQSVKAAKKLQAQPTAENANAFIDALVEDVSKSDEFVDGLNAAGTNAQIAQQTAVNLIANPDPAKKEKAEAKHEQAAAHKVELEASQTRVDVASAAYFERRAAGDTAGAISMLGEKAKAQQGVNEHQREYDQNIEAENRLRGEMIDEAKARATAQVRMDRERVVEQFKNDTTAKERALDTQIAENEAQQAELEEQIAQAEDLADEDALMDLIMRRSELEYEKEALIARARNSSAVLEARSEAQSALNAQDEQAAATLQEVAQKETRAQEKAAMAPVFRDLRTRAIYVDAQQAAEIKNMTGLTIPQFNRKYGFSLTQDKAKGRNSLDGSFFADLAEQAPGYIDAQTTHPEEAIVALAERKKELSAAQASIGETNAEAYVDGVSYGTDDPVTQQLASELKKNTGITLVVANLEDGKRGWYNRKTKELVLSNKLGAGEIRRVVALHELTHHIEKSPGYEAYKKAVLEAAYEGGEDYRAQQLERDRVDIQNEYAERGIDLSPEDVDAELVAAATERVISSDEEFFLGLINGGKRPFLTRVYMKIKGFLARRKAKKNGAEMLAHYDAIQKAHDLMEKALKAAPKDADPNGGIQYAIGWTKDGRQYVEIEEDILKGLPESEWAKAAKDALKRFSDGIPVGKNTIYVSKKTRGEWTNSKDARRTERIAPDMYKDKLRAANNADEILWASTDYINEEAGHGRTDNMQDFARGKVLLSIGENGYQADVVIGLRPDGSLLLYDVTYIEPFDVQKKKPQNSNGSRNSVPISQSVASDISVQQSAQDVNMQSMRNSVQNSIGTRMFGNNSAQRADFISDEVKRLVKDTEYERDTNADQVKRATARMDTLGGADAAAAVLLNKQGMFDADDNALAFVAMAEATRNGDNTTATMLAMRMNEKTGEQGRALQSVQIAGKLTAAGAMAETVRKANRANAKHGIPEGSFPIGEQAPKQGGTTTSEDGKTTRKTPEAVEQVYRDADEVHAALEDLPGEISYENPWALPLSDKQMELIRHYKLLNEKLPGANYNVATVKQRMLAAIIAAGADVQGDGLKALGQQLAAMKAGHAVVTKADLNYTASQMSEFRLVEGEGATEPTTQEGKVALGRAFQAQDNVTQEGLFSKWTALRYMNMLSAPATAVRNVASNVLAGGLEGTSTRVAAYFDRKMAKKTGTRTTTWAIKAERKVGREAMTAETAQTFVDYFVSHVDTGHGRKYAMGGQGRVFESEFLEGMRNLVDFAMQIGDRPFFEKSYSEELAIIKRLGMKKTELGNDDKIVSREMTQDEMHEEATARALRRVFQEDSAVIDAINGLKAKHPAADLFISTLMPFIKTPTNVAMRAVEYSPLGLGITLARGMISGVDSGKATAISQRDYVMGIGRGLTGTGLLAIGYALAASGTIGFGRGEDEEEKRRNVLSALGEPYSMYLKIGDTRREIDWALPMSSAIAIGAELWRNMEDGEGFGLAIYSALLSGVGDQIMSTPMLSAMNDVFRGYSDTEDIATRLAQTATGSLVNQTLSPAVIRAIAKTTDPYVRDTSDSNPVWASLKQNLFQYWPGVRQMLPIKTDMTGDYQLQSGYWNPRSEQGSMVMQCIDSFLTPTATIGWKNDDALCELIDLSYRTGEGSFLPADLITKNKYELKLTKTNAEKLFGMDAAIDMALSDEEKRSINQAHGDLLFNGDGGRPYSGLNGPQAFPGLRAVMNDEARYFGGKYGQKLPWSRMNDEERCELVSKMVSDAKQLIILDVARKKRKAGEI